MKNYKNNEYSFSSRWKSVKENEDDINVKSLFVDIGKKPIVQRQLNLYYYFLFIKNILNKIEAKKVLEVGCGRGTASLFIKKYLNLDTVLLDNAPDAIDIARKEFDKYGVQADFNVGDAFSTGFPDETFDATVSIGLAEHVEDVEGLFKEQYRVLKQGGAIVSLNIPKKFSIQFLNTAMRFFKKLFGLYKEDIRKDYYRNTLTAKDYKNAAINAGFRDVEVTYVCPFPIYTPLTLSSDKKVATFNRFILKIRNIFQKYPYKTNKLFAQAHFLVGYK